MSINNVTLVGRLTKDPELSYTPSGIPKARFTVAVNRAFSNQQGEREADFINCTAWKKQAENLANFQKKGALIGITGRIQTGSYEGQDGKKVYTTEVVAESIQYLEARNSGENAPAPNNGVYQQQQNAPQQQYQQPPQQQYSQQQAPPQYQNQQQYGQQQQRQTPPQQNYTRVDEDPFANRKGGPVTVSEDDLPF